MEITLGGVAISEQTRIELLEALGLTDAGEQALAAAASAVAAEEAKDASLLAALTQAGIGTDVATENAAVAEGETFWIYSDGFLVLYRKVGGVATAVEGGRAPLEGGVLSERSYGNVASRDIPISLNGATLVDPGPVVFVGKDNSTSNAAQYHGVDFPPGVGLARMRGSHEVPVIPNQGDQLGFHDYYAFSDGELKLAGSFDMVTSTTIPYVDGETPPTKFRWAISDKASTVVKMELQPSGRLELGALENGGDDYYGPGVLGDSKLYVTSGEADYSAIISSHRAAGGFALRLNTRGATAADYPLIVSSGVNGENLNVAVDGRGWTMIGGYQPQAPFHVNATNANDWAARIAGQDFGARFDIVATGQTNIVAAGYANNVETFSSRGNGDLYAAGAMKPGSFTVGTQPDPALGAGRTIHVVDDVGGTCLAMSDGTDFRRVKDDAVISAT